MQKTSLWTLSLFLFLPLLFAFNDTKMEEAPAEEATTAIHLGKLCQMLSLGLEEYNPACVPGSVGIEMSQDCEGYAQLDIFCTNLYAGFGGTSPVIGNSYDLPTGYPALWAQYESSPGDIKYSGPHTSFTYMGLQMGVNGMLAPIYQVSDLVHHEDVNANSCETTTGSHYSATMHVEIMEKTPMGYVIYNVAQYSGTTDIFSCEVFVENCFLCQGPGGTTHGCEEDKPLDPIYDFDLCIDCSSCSGETRPFTTDNEHVFETTAGSGAINLSISPNPFQDRLEYRYDLTQTGLVTVEVFDISGKRVWQQTTQEIKGRRSANWNAADLPEGIYYLHIQTPEDSAIVPLTKLKK